MKLAQEHHAPKTNKIVGGRKMGYRARLQRVRLGLAMYGGVVLLAMASTTQASTVLRVGISDLLQNSQLVIHGHVTDAWTSYDTQRDTVFTNVRIVVEETVKGDLSDDHVVIRFEGGTHGNKTVSIGGMVLPIPGEEGVYFIENLSRVQVNPFYGWNQGRYVVRYADDGREKEIMTSDLRPVYSIAAASRKNSVAFSKGVPAGVDTVENSSKQPMTVGEFTSALRQIMEAGE